MDTMTHLHRTTDDDTLPLRVVVETDEHEAIELRGCSEAEVEAKLRDLYTWAS